MIKIKTAKELFKISQSSAPRIVENILDGVKEHIIFMCEEEANKGHTNYTCVLKRGERALIKDLLLEECVKLAKEFDKNGYKVSIEDHNANTGWIGLVINFSWNDKLVEFEENKGFYEYKLLYTTDDGVIG